MNRPVDHALVEELLADETLSYKEIARRADCSDFSVRTIARKLSGDDRPMKTPRVRPSTDDEWEEPRALTTAEAAIAWGVGALLLVCFVWAAWKGQRFDYPPEGPMP